MPVAQVAPDVWRVQAPIPAGSVNLYVVTGDRLAVIDTGYREHPESVLAPALLGLGLRLEDVDVILNTHGHPDHAGGNARLQAASAALIALHPGDLDLARGPEAHLDSSADPSYVMKALGWAGPLAERSAFVHDKTEGPFEVSFPLSDGALVELGRARRLRVVHAPGHTPGSTVYLDESTGEAFSGDAIQGWGLDDRTLPLYFDPDAYLESLLRIRSLGIRRLFAGHDFLWSKGSVPASSSADVTKLIDDSIDAVAQINEATRAVAAMTLEPLERLIQQALACLDAPLAGRPMSAASASTLYAHLKGRRP